MTWHCPICGKKLLVLYGTLKECKNEHRWRVTADETGLKLQEVREAQAEEPSPDGPIM